MDVMLQRHCARYIYVVPDGLRELMSDISREVLRSQPEDIYTFVADYLDALLITRENARISAKFVQTMTDAAETIVELLERSGMTRSAADHAAEVIQAAFRTWSSRRGILKEDEDAMINRIIEEAGITELQAQEAAVCIQHAFHAFKIRQQREQELLGDAIDWRVAARSAIRLYRKTGVSPEEAKKAANTIKAAYKGYYTRRTLRKLNEVNASIPGEEEEEDYDNISVSSALGSDKKKGVRLDFATILPHVDFGGEELIEKDDVIAEDEDHFPVETLVDETEEDDVMKKIFGGTRKTEESDSESFIKGILDECFKSAVIRKYGGRRDEGKRSESIKEEEALDPITKEDEEFQQGAMVAKEIIEKLQEGRDSQLISQTTEKKTVENLETTTTEKEDAPTEPPSTSAEPANEPEQSAEVPEPPAEAAEEPEVEETKAIAEEPEEQLVKETKPPAEEPEEPLVEETKPITEQPAEEPEQPPAEEPEQPPVEEPPANEQPEPPGDEQTVPPPAEEPPTEKPEDTPPKETPLQHPEGGEHSETASAIPETKSVITESSVLV